MEWTELQVMWQQYDARLTENTRINKEILKRMLRSKPEKRLTRMRGWGIFGLVMPISVACIALIPNVKFRNEWDFYLGLFLLTVVLLAGIFYQYFQNVLLMRDIDFTKQVAKTKKQLLRLAEARLRATKWGYITLITGMVGVCLIGQLPVMTIKFAGIALFIIILAIISSHIHSKKFKSQLSNFNAELEEIEQLEKD
jgi:hypothetical protein